MGNAGYHCASKRATQTDYARWVEASQVPQEQLPEYSDVYRLGREGASIRSARIKNFRSIRDAEVQLSPLTVLVGANGAGKSNVVDVFRFVSESLSLGLRAGLERRGGLQAVRHRSVMGRPRNVRIELEIAFPNGYMGEYGLQVSAQAAGAYTVAYEAARLISPPGFVFGEFEVANGELKTHPKVLVRDERGTMNFGEMVPPVTQGTGAFNPALLAFPLLGVIPGLGGLLDFLQDLRSYSIVPDRLREPQDPDEGHSLHADGRNATSVLRYLEPNDRAELIEMLAHAVPGIEDVRTVSHGNKLTLEFTQRTPRGRNRFEAHQMSDGTLRLLGILLALYQPKLSQFIAIEEPEATVHVAALEAMVEVFRLRAQHAQILLTTHSADILDFVDIDDVQLVRAEQGHSTVGGVAAHSKEVVRDELFTPGELLRTGALRARDQDVTASV